MRLNSKEFRYKNLIFILLFLSVILIHTMLIANGYVSSVYERLRDLLISLMAFYMFYYYYRNAKKSEYFKSKYFKVYLLILNMYILIFIIHLLRMFFGGLKC